MKRFFTDQLQPLSKLKFGFLALCLVVVFGFAIQVHTNMWDFDTEGQDVYYAWVEGTRILTGQNPYARILQGNMFSNNKYATYFPLFYLLSALTQVAGLQTYSDWIGFWRYIFLFFNLGIGALIFLVYYQKQRLLLALLAAALWLLNNWALTVSLIAHIDFIPLFFLLLSLVLFDRHLPLSLLALSLSLALKQIAIFLVPLYLIWVWRASRQNPLKETIVAGLIITSLPFLLSLPFIVWEPEGFFKSVLFSATRHGYSGYSVGMELNAAGGLFSRLPLFLLLALVYALSLRETGGRYSNAMLVMLIFTGLTPLLFPQYLVWVIALIILSVHDTLASMWPRPSPAPG